MSFSDASFKRSTLASRTSMEDAPSVTGWLLKRSEWLRSWNAREITLTPRRDNDGTPGQLQWHGGSRSGVAILDESCVATLVDDQLLLRCPGRVLRFRSAGRGEGTIQEWYEAIQTCRVGLPSSNYSAIHEANAADSSDTPASASTDPPMTTEGVAASQLHELTSQLSKAEARAAASEAQALAKAAIAQTEQRRLREVADAAEGAAADATTQMQRLQGQLGAAEERAAVATTRAEVAEAKAAALVLELEAAHAATIAADRAMKTAQARAAIVEAKLTAAHEMGLATGSVAPEPLVASISPMAGQSTAGEEATAGPAVGGSGKASGDSTLSEAMLAGAVFDVEVESPSRGAVEEEERSAWSEEEGAADVTAVEEAAAAAEVAEVTEEEAAAEVTAVVKTEAKIPDGMDSMEEERGRLDVVSVRYGDGGDGGDGGEGGAVAEQLVQVVGDEITLLDVESGEVARQWAASTLIDCVQQANALVVRLSATPHRITAEPPSPPGGQARRKSVIGAMGEAVQSNLRRLSFSSNPSDPSPPRRRSSRLAAKRSEVEDDAKMMSDSRRVDEMTALTTLHLVLRSEERASELKMKLEAAAALTKGK